MFKKITAFTLAEVLITLTIIGVVAALTIPALMNYTHGLENKVAWKKTFSMYSQAFMQMANDYGQIGDDTTDDGHWINAHIGNYIKAIEPMTPYECSSNYSYMRTSGSCYFGILTAQDGVRMIINGSPYDLSFDVNGEKGPNYPGQDIFAVSWTKQGKLIPFGSAGASVTDTSTCHPNDSDYNADNPKYGWPAWSNGIACSAEYLLE